jgi:thioesterase-3
LTLQRSVTTGEEVVSPVHEHSILVVERHLDTFGHVNNATYLELFEAARWEWITANGFGLERIQALQLGPTVLEVTLRFKREVKNRQRILVRTWVESYTGKVCTVLQEMRDESNELCCDARFTCALFDLKARRLVAPTEEWLRSLGVERLPWPVEPR